MPEFPGRRAEFARALLRAAAKEYGADMSSIPSPEWDRFTKWAKNMPADAKGRVYAEARSMMND